MGEFDAKPGEGATEPIAIPLPPKPEEEHALNIHLPEYEEFYNLFPAIILIKEEGVKLINESIGEARKESWADKDAERIVICNEIYRRYILQRDCSRSQEIKANENPWIKNYTEAVAVYERESSAHRAVLISYCIKKCLANDHTPDECLFAHGTEEIRRRPLWLRGGENLLITR